MTIYENKWCRIISRDGFYILQSKSGQYNDIYFTTAKEAFRAIGMNSQKEG